MATIQEGLLLFLSGNCINISAVRFQSGMCCEVLSRCPSYKGRFKYFETTVVCVTRP